MASMLTLRVYRRLDNRAEGLPDDSPRALELHQRRAAALEEVFKDIDGLEVIDWGKTKDEKAHEVIEIHMLVQKAAEFLAANPEAAALATALSPAFAQVIRLIAGKLADAAVSEAIKVLFERLKRQQEQKRIYNFICSISMPSETIELDCKENEIYVTRCKTVVVRVDAGKEQIASLQKLFTQEGSRRRATVMQTARDHLQPLYDFVMKRRT